MFRSRTIAASACDCQTALRAVPLVPDGKCPMSVTLEQITAMAPDAAAVAAGRKLADKRHWPELGQSAEALWGRCQGSAVYQVRIELVSLGNSCSCPSRKFPCKHVLALLMLAAGSPEALAAAPNPDWVAEWLQKRQLRQEKRSEVTANPTHEAAQSRRVEQRDSRVSAGLERLALVLQDLLRNGLAAVELQSATFWNENARRLVDAQAPGLATRIARLAKIPHSSRDWPERLLGELGRIQLLIEAWSRLEHLSPDLQSEVRQTLGWTVSQEELVQEGETITDRWAVIGQRLDDEDRIRTQRSWLRGRRTGRTALLLQFAAGQQPFPEAVVPGLEQEATVIFYPGTARQRVRLQERTGTATLVNERITGWLTLEDLLREATDLWSRCPWSTTAAGLLRDVTVVPDGQRWWVRDSTGAALPLAGSAGWQLLAVSGGHALDLVVEWDGRSLSSLATFCVGRYGVV